MASVLPGLVGGMMNNAQTPEGQGGLLGALLGGKHDGGILGHVLGDKHGAVASQVSQQTGVGSDQVAMIMKIAAPILMGYLAKKAMGGGLTNNAAQSGGGLTDILGGLLGGGQQAAPAAAGGNILTSMLDQDGDGQLGIGDAIAAATKSGGLGGMLGGLFGKK